VSALFVPGEFCRAWYGGFAIRGRVYTSRSLGVHCTTEYSEIGPPTPGFSWGVIAKDTVRAIGDIVQRSGRGRFLGEKGVGHRFEFFPALAAHHTAHDYRGKIGELFLWRLVR
jgi:hypothetical protein